MTDTNAELIVVYHGDHVHAEMVCNMLADNGIEARTKNQLMGTIAPYQVAAGGFEPVEVEVLAHHKEKALQLIEEFNNSAE